MAVTEGSGTEGAGTLLPCRYWLELKDDERVVVERGDTVASIAEAVFPAPAPVQGVEVLPLPVEEAETELGWAFPELWNRLRQQLGLGGKAPIPVDTVLPEGVRLWVPRLCGHPVFKPGDTGRGRKYCVGDQPQDEPCAFCADAGVTYTHTSRHAAKRRDTLRSNRSSTVVSGDLSDPLAASLAAVTLPPRPVVIPLAAHPVSATPPSRGKAEQAPQAVEPVSDVRAEESEPTAVEGDSGSEQAADPVDRVRAALTPMVDRLTEAVRSVATVRAEVDAVSVEFERRMAAILEQVAEAEQRAAESDSAAQQARKEMERVAAECESAVAAAQREAGEARTARENAEGAAKVLQSELEETKQQCRELQQALLVAGKEHRQELDRVRDAAQDRADRMIQQAYERIGARLGGAAGPRPASPSPVRASGDTSAARLKGDREQRIAAEVHRGAVRRVVRHRGSGKEWRIGSSKPSGQDVRALNELESRKIIAVDLSGAVGEDADGQVYAVYVVDPGVLG